MFNHWVGRFTFWIAARSFRLITGPNRPRHRTQFHKAGERQELLRSVDDWDLRGFRPNPSLTTAELSTAVDGSASNQLLPLLPADLPLQRPASEQYIWSCPGPAAHSALSALATRPPSRHDAGQRMGRYYRPCLHTAAPPPQSLLMFPAQADNVCTKNVML